MKINHTSIWTLKSFLCLAGFFLSVSCKKLIEIESPKNELSNSIVFSDSSTASSAMLGLYTVMYNFNYIKSTPFQDYLTTLGGLSADELYYFPNTTMDQYLNNRIQVTDNANLAMWADPYSFIYQANNILEGLKNSTTLSNSLKKQLNGEALTLRALCYFYLVNYFGNVPLILNTSVIENNQQPQTGKDSVYKQIIADLKLAKPLLAADYSYSNDNRTRINYFAASAILARAYLFTGDWENAEKEATEVIDNTDLYALSPLDDIFKANSSEAIFQFYTNRLSYPAIARVFIPGGDGSDIPNYVITDHLLQSFESGDNRKEAWIGNINYNGEDYAFPYKYKTSTPGAGMAEFDMVLRLSEQYLIRAEARAELNQLQDARDDLDEIRQRAGLEKVDADDQDELRDAVLRERQIEFCFEYGHRWLDLKRSGRIDEILNSVKPGKWRSEAVLFPIPQTAINTNTKLKQNDGYR